MSEQLLSILRYGLTFLGGLLANYGIFSDSEWTTLSGAILAVIPVLWSWWQRQGTTRVPTETLTTKQASITGVQPTVK